MALTTAVVVGTAAAGAYGARQSRRAGEAQARSYDAATAEQARQFDIAQEAQAPYRQVGTAALNQLAALYGLPQYQQPQEQPLSFDEWAAQNVRTGGAGGIRGAPVGNALGRQQYDQYLQNFTPQTQPSAQAPSFENFFASPDYQFALRQGQQSVENSAAARGGLYSGNALRAITEYGQGMASQQLNNYANRLAGIAGVGQTAATQTGQNAMAYGNNVSNLLVGQGNARASGIQGQANAWTNTANQLAMLYGAGAFGGGGGGGANTWAMNYGGPIYGGYA